MFRPDLNCIEQWNAAVKRKFRNMLLKDLLLKENVSIGPIVTRAINSVE